MTKSNKEQCRKSEIGCGIWRTEEKKKGKRNKVEKIPEKRLQFRKEREKKKSSRIHFGFSSHAFVRK